MRTTFNLCFLFMIATAFLWIVNALPAPGHNDKQHVDHKKSIVITNIQQQQQGGGGKQQAQHNNFNVFTTTQTRVTRIQKSSPGDKKQDTTIIQKQMIKRDGAPKNAEEKSDDVKKGASKKVESKEEHVTNLFL